MSVDTVTVSARGAAVLADPLTNKGTAFSAQERDVLGLDGLLPPLSPKESLEVTAVHSVAGTLPPGQPLVDRPPYCAPHHSATMASLVGGGTGLPRPGAVSLAHHGVLFVDEAAECDARVLDALRQPLESGHVVVARAAGMMRMPARFLLALAANPCPCGRHGTTGGGCGIWSRCPSSWSKVVGCWPSRMLSV